MYSNKNILYIISSLSAIEKIADYTTGYANAEELLQSNNQLNFNGTITLLIAIAEESKKIDNQLLKKYKHIEWQNIADMRNMLAHDYKGIDPEIVFDVVKNELLLLKKAFLEMLKDFPPNALNDILQTKQYSHLKSLF